MNKKLRPILKVLKKKKINTNIKKKILTLKKQHYKFSIKSQNKWFKDNIKKDDYHNLLFFKKDLIGYNCLRKVKLLIMNDKKKIKKDILLFDTLVFDKEYRGLGLSKKIMFSSNKIILKKKLFGLLFCEKKMIKYYFKFKWKFLKKSQIKSNKSLRLNTMIFNSNSQSLKNKILYLNL